MQKRHIDLAIATGVKPENCFILPNGKVLTFSDNKVFSLYSVQSGNIYVDDDNIEIEGSIIKERKLLSEEGIVAVIYSINKNGELITSPNIITRGFIYVKNTDAIMKGIKLKSEQLYNSIIRNKAVTSRTQMSNIISYEISNYIQLKTDRKPIVQVIYMDC